MSGATFIHLRVHTAYSLSEGALPIKALAAMAKDARMPALAATDSGNLFGALEFSDAVSGKGIQPIIGLEMRVDLTEAQANPHARFQQQSGLKRFPSLVLLAQNETGYRNLMVLSSAGFLETPDNAEPHVTFAKLASHAEGLICLTGGPGGPINQALTNAQMEQATSHLQRLKAIFDNRLYVELQRHGTEAERLAEPGLLSLAYQQELPLVATNECFFEKPDDYAAHDALICIAEGEVVSEPNRRRVTPEHFFKNQQQMAALFADLPEAVENTIEIAKRCAFWVQSRKPILPRFAEGDEAELLRLEANKGLEARLAVGMSPGFSRENYQKRLDFELSVITKMNYQGYFLIVADFIRWAKSQGIPVGPGRGSGASSLVAYSLTITDVDPLHFGLFFERFLNPERVSMPDFDVDFCQDRRDEVIAYVQRRYGEDRVAQIITFGKLQSRAVTRDVGRVLQMPYGHVDRLSKLIPNTNPANPITLGQAIEMEPRLQEERDRDPNVANLFQIALKLEGLYRNASTHAGGIVIADRPLEQLVALYRDPRSTTPATQFHFKDVEKAGLVKFDFLGLKTLTVIDKAQKLVRLREPGFDINKVPVDDADSYSIIARGETVGIFQMESSGMRDAARNLKADKLEDLLALIALYRPGPMAQIPVYCARKNGKEKVEYLHPILEPILKETFGVITYQEDVQKIARAMAGYSMAEADLLRRAMGKKIKSEMDAQRTRFMKGAAENGVPEDVATATFEACAKFAEYGFPKGHAAPYAVIALQTAYLKAHYPAEFIAASMTLDMGNTDKLSEFRSEALRLGLKLIPPSINESAVEFAVKDGAVVYSLAALKNVGAGAIGDIITARNAGGKFKSLSDFAKRVDAKALNRRGLESLIKAGAFDHIQPNRAAVLDATDSIIGIANRTASETAAGQNDMFGAIAAASGDEIVLPRRDAWLPMERLGHEFDAVGFYLSGHPLDEYAKTLTRLGVESWATFQEKTLLRGAGAAKLAGTVTQKQERRSRQGNKFAFVTFSDSSGQFEAVVFADTLNAFRDLLEPGRAVVLRVEAEAEGEEIKTRVQSVEALDKAAASVVQGIKIFVRDSGPMASIAKRLSTGGKAPARITLIHESGGEVEISLGSKFEITPQIKGAIKTIPGVVEVQDL